MLDLLRVLGTLSAIAGYYFVVKTKYKERGLWIRMLAGSLLLPYFIVNLLLDQIFIVLFFMYIDLTALRDIYKAKVLKRRQFKKCEKINNKDE